MQSSKVTAICRLAAAFAFMCMLHVRASSQGNAIGAGILMDFDGVSANYLDVGDVYNELDFPFTIESWLHLADMPPDWAGIFSTENSSSGNYYGFWTRVSSTGQVQIEFGDSYGAGSEFRRGKQTVNALEVDEWVHVSVVAHTISAIEIYFNGELQSTFSTDGSSSFTGLTHSGNTVMVGKQVNIFNSHEFTGQLDEMRFWETARTQSEIRENMCRKIDPASSGLIGYWNVDESYSSDSVIDLTIPAESGVIAGNVGKITSGAPIGDASSFVYPSGWSGVAISASHSSGDSLLVENVSGNPHGVHVYRVDSLPYDTAGLDFVPAHYFGVFCARKNMVPKYDVTYHYDYGNLVINPLNEETAALYSREDGSVTEWQDELASLDLINNELVKELEPVRGEYILSVSEVTGANFTSTTQQLCEKFCTDYADLSGNNPTSWSWTFEGGSPGASTLQHPAEICYSEPGSFDVMLVTTSATGDDTLLFEDWITVYDTPAFPVITQDGSVLTSSLAASYQWQYNAADIPGATGQSHNALQSGLYTVVIKDENGCQNSTSMLVIYDGMQAAAGAAITIFPTPADDRISVKTGNYAGQNLSIRIISLTGNRVLELSVMNASEMISVDVSSVSPGVYLVEVQTSHGLSSAKLEVRR